MSISIETRSLPDRQAPIFQQVPDVLARVYAARGVIDLNDLGRGLKELLPVTQMAGIPAAVERIALAMENQERILILGDFDCDGATSTAVAISALTSMGASDVDYLVPNRFEFGYGLSPEIVEVAAEKSAQLIITVDNGISSVEGVERANALGIDVIVTDHHLAGSELPSAVAIVNPNQPSCIFPAKSTCGVGVIFYVMIALRRYLDEQGWFLTKQIPAPNLGELLDLVALGTVADVVALEKNNRVLVHQGLQRIRAGHLRPGLRALLAVADRDTRSITAADLGFAIAPRLNAAGRLDDMSLGIECLLARTDEDANIFAQQLNQLNLDRRGIESDMQQQAQVLLDDLNIKQEGLPFGICLFNQDWHQGVIGILASRVKEKYHRPVVAFAPAENGELKGSARSIAGFHIRDGLDAIAAKHPALLRKFGGHAMAAGLTIGENDFDTFQAAFAKQVEETISHDDLTQKLITDGELSAHELCIESAELLRSSGPWGQAFPAPSFVGEFSLLQQRIVGQKHLKLVLMEPQTGIALDAIHFNADTTQWPDEGIHRAKVVYRLDVNHFRGQRTLQLMIDYIEPLGV